MLWLFSHAWGNHKLAQIHRRTESLYNTNGRTSKGTAMRKHIIGLILFNVLIWGWNLAHAGDATLTWQAPTSSLTGERDASGNCITTPIPATGPEALAGFRIVYNTSVAALNLPPPDTDCGKTTKPQPTGVVVDITNPASRAATISGLPAGTYYFMIAAINNAGAVSFFTGPGSKTIVEATPTFSTIETNVYNVVKRANGFVLVVVGTVPLNTPCDTTQIVNGYNAVLATPQWSGTVKPIVVVGKCSLH